MLFLSFCFRYVFHFASKFQFYKTHSNISCKFKHILYYGPLKQSLLPWGGDFQVAIYDKLTDVLSRLKINQTIRASFEGKQTICIKLSSDRSMSCGNCMYTQRLQDHYNREGMWKAKAENNKKERGRERV